MRRFLSLALAAILSFSLAPANALAPTSPTQTISNDARDAAGDEVYVVRGSDINLVSRESKVPVRIQNDFDADVRLLVHVQPNNYRLVVPNVVEVVVPALTEVTAQVPVKAIANGPVGLQVWITTFSGIPLGDTTTLQMQINADVEFALLLGLAAIVVTLGSLGVVRTLRKRRTREDSDTDEGAEALLEPEAKA